LPTRLTAMPTDEERDNRTAAQRGEDAIAGYRLIYGVEPTEAQKERLRLCPTASVRELSQIPPNLADVDNMVQDALARAEGTKPPRTMADHFRLPELGIQPLGGPPPGESGE